MTGYVLEKIYLAHDPGPGHPESPDRLKAVQAALKGFKNLKKVSARAASKEEICLVHEAAYFEKVKATQGHRFFSLDPDTGTNEKSFEAAVWAAGGVLALIGLVFKKEIKNGFAFVRPPGHHAEFDRAMGFCLFNNIAIGAAYARKKYKIKKVLIIDIDLHHGNGTQNSFYNTDQVMYISTHQFPYYPGTGSFEETGSGKGEGYNLNFPLGVGAGDDFYNKLFEKAIIPIAKQYKPELVLVSCGFDTYFADPLGGMRITERGYAGMTKKIIDLSEKFCEGRLIYVLEGGYNMEGIEQGTKSVLEEMRGSSKEISFKEPENFKSYYELLKKHHNKYWKF